MIWNPLHILSGLFGGYGADPHAPHPDIEQDRAAAARDSAHDLGKRWSQAMQRSPDLRGDLIRLGGLFVPPPVQNIDGYPEPVTQDPYQCGREAGRRELAIQLLAAGSLTIEDLNQMMEDDDVHR